jgi:hypothetical protein
MPIETGSFVITDMRRGIKVANEPLIQMMLWFCLLFLLKTNKIEETVLSIRFLAQNIQCFQSDFSVMRYF